MKAKMTFTLPEELDEYKIFTQAQAMHAALHEFSEYLRNQYKYIESKDRDDLIKIREHFHELLSSRNIELF